MQTRSGSLLRYCNTGLILQSMKHLSQQEEEHKYISHRGTASKVTDLVFVIGSIWMQSILLLSGDGNAIHSSLTISLTFVIDLQCHVERYFIPSFQSPYDPFSHRGQSRPKCFGERLGITFDHIIICIVFMYVCRSSSHACTY